MTFVGQVAELADVVWLIRPGGIPLRPQPTAMSCCGSCWRSYLNGAKFGGAISPRDWNVLYGSTAHIGTADGTTACGRDLDAPGWWSS